MLVYVYNNFNNVIKVTSTFVMMTDVECTFVTISQHIGRTSNITFCLAMAQRGAGEAMWNVESEMAIFIASPCRVCHKYVIFSQPPLSQAIVIFHHDSLSTQLGEFLHINIVWVSTNALTFNILFRRKYILVWRQERQKERQKGLTFTALRCCLVLCL